MNRPASDSRKPWTWVAVALGTILVIALLRSLAEVLAPFLFASIIGYVLRPGVDWLARHRVPRSLATLAMILLFFGVAAILVLTIVPVLQSELAALQQRFPEILERANSEISPRLYQWMGVHVHFTGSSIRKLISDQWANEDLMSTVFSSLRVGGAAVVSVLATALVVPMVLFYLLLDWHSIIRKVAHAIPRRLVDSLTSMVREIDALLAQFLRGQVSVMVLLALYYSIALSVAGFDVALPVGIFTGLLVFVPYLGYATGLCLALLAALLQFSNTTGIVLVVLVYGVGQVLESFILTPRLVGERIGLHPLAVIFALLAFGKLFGFFGVLLALPASAALLVALRRLKVRYLASSFYQRT